MKFSNFFHKIKVFLESNVHPRGRDFQADKKRDYFVKNIHVPLLNVPRSIFLVVKKYGWVVFFHKCISFLREFCNHYRRRAKSLYIHARLSFKKEGFLTVLLRTFNYFIYGKGVLNKNEIIKNNEESELEKYDVEKVLSLDVDKVDKIFFEKEENPKVSIVIPVFNKWQYTYNCLDSLKKNIQTDTSYEIIVVDDGSSDETAEMIAMVENVKYVKNEKNLGFVGSCNGGAKIAKGKYLVFLNNDTAIKKNWLEALLETFEKNENIGLSGSKLIYPDGRLQEAGGIIWKNQNAWNYGRYGNPTKPEFNYLKDVNYCSGASIILSREIFEKLGGFDEIFSPGYFEDTDLAFRIRQMGLRTVYQPKSELFHFEGISSGNDLSSGMKKYQEINKKTFFERWGNILEKENYNDFDGQLFFARDKSIARKVVLFMDHNIPTFDKDAGSFIAFQYLKILKDLGYKIIFWPHNLAKLDPYTDILQQMGIEVFYGNQDFGKFMKENGKFLNFAFISRPQVAREYLDILKENSNARILYIPHDLHFLREMRTAQVSKDENLKKQSLETKKIEKLAMEKSDISLFFSDKEVEIVEAEFPNVSVGIIPWIQKIENEKPVNFEDREGLIFIGGYNHKPNVDAVKWFHDEIFPLVLEKIPSIKVIFYGSNPPKEITGYNCKNFQIAGFIEEADLKNIFNAARVFIAPLRFGAGFKGKVAKAMSNGLPVVTTAIGAEGIGLIDGKNVLIAKDEARDFAEKIVSLYGDEKKWRELSLNSIAHLEENFSVENATKKISEILKKV